MKNQYLFCSFIIWMYVKSILVSNIFFIFHQIEYETNVNEIKYGYEDYDYNDMIADLCKYFPVKIYVRKASRRYISGTIPRFNHEKSKKQDDKVTYISNIA